MRLLLLLLVLVARGQAADFVLPLSGTTPWLVGDGYHDAMLKRIRSTWLERVRAANFGVKAESYAVISYYLQPDGTVEIAPHMEQNCGKAASEVALAAIKAAQPFPAWSKKLKEALGNEREVQLLFCYGWPEEKIGDFVARKQKQYRPETVAETMERERREGPIRAAKERREKAAALRSAHPDWPEAVQAAVLAREIIVGMPSEAFELVWGKPNRRTISGGIGGAAEVWFYDHADYSWDSFYFVEGRLARWVLSRK